MCFFPTYSRFYDMLPRGSINVETSALLLRKFGMTDAAALIRMGFVSMVINHPVIVRPYIMLADELRRIYPR